jgi:hypothetical protein
LPSNERDWMIPADPVLRDGRNGPDPGGPPSRGLPSSSPGLPTRASAGAGGRRATSRSDRPAG